MSPLASSSNPDRIGNVGGEQGKLLAAGSETAASFAVNPPRRLWYVRRLRYAFARIVLLCGKPQADVAPLGTEAFLVFKFIKNWPATNNASPIKAAEKMLLRSEVSKPLDCW